MTIAYGCVLITIIFPYVFTVLAKTEPGFDNQDPRGYLEKIHGWRRRAHYTQLNSFEIMPAFASAVIIAHLTHASQPTLDKLAIAFIITRLLYAVCYLSDKAALRTLFWAIGFGCIISMFFIQ